MKEFNPDKVVAYLEAKKNVDAKSSPPSLAVRLLQYMNRIFNTTFGEGSENLTLVYERNEKRAHLFSTLSTREKIAAGLQMGQFYVLYNFHVNGVTQSNHLMFQDWCSQHKAAYRDYWSSEVKGEDRFVLKGPILGDVSSDQLTDNEQNELKERRRLRAEAKPGEQTILYWTRVGPDRREEER